MNAISTRQTVPVWSWNGYNEQWCESFADRETVIKEAMSHMEREGGKLETATVIEDDEHVTITVESGYEFYGWRWKVYVFTTRPGAFVMDEDDNTLGEWTPAA